MKKSIFPIAAILFMVATCWVTLHNHHAFLAQFDQALYQNDLWLIANGFPVYSTLLQGHIFGDHFTPVHYLVSIPFRWFPSYELYLVIHLLLLVLGAAAVRRIGMELLQCEVSAGLCAAAYLASPLTLGIASYPLPAWSAGMACFLWTFALRGDGRCLVGGLCLATLCTEVSVLPFFGLGIFLFLSGRRRHGLALALAAAGLAVLLTQVVVPSFGSLGSHEGLERQFSRYDHYKASPALVLERLATHFSVYWQWDKLIFAQMLLGTVGLGFLAPSAWFLFLPGLALNLLADFFASHSNSFHYQMSVVGGLYIAAFLGLQKLDPSRHKLAASLMLAGSLLSIFFLNPLKAKESNPRRVFDYQAALSMLPAGESVAAPPTALAHLPFRSQLFSVPALSEHPTWLGSPPEVAKVKWIVLDLHSAGFPGKNFRTLRITQILEDPNYGLHGSSGALLVLRRGSREPVPPSVVSQAPEFTLTQQAWALVQRLPAQALKLLNESGLNDSESVYLKGLCLQRLGELDEAQAAFQQAVALNPEDPLKTAILKSVAESQEWRPKIYPDF